MSVPFPGGKVPSLIYLFSYIIGQVEINHRMVIENTHLGFLICYEENLCSEFDLCLKNARSSNQVLGLVHPIRKLVQTHAFHSTNVMANIIPTFR